MTSDGALVSLSTSARGLASWRALASLFERSEKLRYVSLLALTLIGSGLEILGVASIAAFVAALTSPERILASPWIERAHAGLGVDVSTQQRLVLVASIGLPFIFVVKNAYHVLLIALQSRITERHRVRLSSDLYECYLVAPYEDHVHRHSADIIRTVSVETGEIMNTVINPLLTGAMGLIVSIGVVTFLAISTPAAASGAAAIVGGAALAFVAITRRRTQRLGKEARRMRKASIRFVGESMSLFAEIRMLGRESWAITHATRLWRNAGHAARMLKLLRAIANSGMETVSVAGLCGIVIVLMLFEGQASAEVLPSVALLAGGLMRLRTSANQVVDSWSQIQSGIVAVPRVAGDLVGFERGIPSKASPIKVQESIELAGVSFHYRGSDRETLVDIDARIPKGGRVAFVGPTGSGKSTLLAVILGLVKPSSGKVLVDGAPIEDRLSAWRASIGYVPQQITLMDSTIAENVALGVPVDEIDRARVDAALKAAQVHDFVTSLERGADTTVGERGVRLSGGQRQRIGLARALYEDPSVLILDEATSALDTVTENSLMRAIDEVKGRTIIIVTHRLSTARGCENIYFLAEGRIRSCGGFDELLEKDDRFRALVEAE
ncbi:MAG: ABC transporter ATP-binding protein [Deltaproteobacteria bacterium]|nr:ABC transporter ATP-binding protein [Deltaproteobacteria bacterium]